MRKILLLTASTIIVLGILAAVGLDYAIDNILPYSPIRPQRIRSVDVQRAFGGPLTPSTVGLQWQQFNITVDDSIPLRGWFVQSATEPTHGTILLLHGIGSSKEFMLPIAAMLARNGFNTVLYDSRAHGESGGANCTFGYYEKNDVSRYIDSTMARYPGSGPYAVFGSSLGAAVAIQAMATDKRIACGVAESPFADLRQVIHDYFARMFFIRADFIPDRALVITQQIAHFAVDSVQPAVAARSITQPTMVIHGLKDDRINPAYGRLVFEHLASQTKEWYPVPAAGHDNVRRVGGAEFDQRVSLFFLRNLKRD